jgi:hypothetical protein
MKTPSWTSGIVALLAALSLGPEAMAETMAIQSLDHESIRWSSVPGTTCHVERATSLTGAWERLESGIAVTNDSAGTGIQPADFCFYRVASTVQYLDFASPANWEAYDASATDALTTKGYSGGIFDGRFVYFVPNYNGLSSHACVLRYDTQLAFTNSEAWAAHDANGTDGYDIRGFIGGTYDGRYVYFAPFIGGTPECILRYDTRGDFKTSASWRVYDARPHSLSTLTGYMGAVYANQYVYFIGHAHNGGMVLRYDTRGDFVDPGNWLYYDDGLSGAGFHHYEGATFDGRYLYLVPNLANQAIRPQSGLFVRYDTSLPLTNASSWSSFSYLSAEGSNRFAYKGAVYDGRYVYYAPDKRTNYTETKHGLAVRYDTQSDFTNAEGWASFDASAMGGLDCRGYAGAAFDGRFVYYVPNGEPWDNHGNALTYDTHQPFIDSNSWMSVSMTNLLGAGTRAFFGAVYDGTYLYYAPMKGSPAGRVVRFKTKMPNGVPGTISGGSFF